MDQVPPAASTAATAVDASSSKAAAAAAGNDDEADKAGAGTTTAVMEPQPFFPFMLHVGGVLILSWLASAFSINSILIMVISFIYLYHVEKQGREREHRWIRHQERRKAHIAGVKMQKFLY
jgi:hypothetical protein